MYANGAKNAVRGVDYYRVRIVRRGPCKDWTGVVLRQEKTPPGYLALLLDWGSVIYARPEDLVPEVREGTGDGRRNTDEEEWVSDGSLASATRMCIRTGGCGSVYDRLPPAVVRRPPNSRKRAKQA